MRISGMSAHYEIDICFADGHRDIGFQFSIAREAEDANTGGRDTSECRAPFPQTDAFATMVPFLKYLIGNFLSSRGFFSPFLVSWL